MDRPQQNGPRLVVEADDHRGRRQVDLVSSWSLAPGITKEVGEEIVESELRKQKGTSTLFQD